MIRALLSLALIALPAQAVPGASILLDFHAEWCPPCQQMRPVIEQLIERGYPVQSVDVDDRPDLADRFGIRAIPAFLVLDETGQVRARTTGVLSAAQLAWIYERASRGPNQDGEQDQEFAAETAPENPKPWQTGVRIRNHEGGVIGFGSGTIISSTAGRSLVLTCAHLFKTPGQTVVDLSDGSHQAEVLDRDFSRDVALVQIRPGRELPYSRIVPTSWKPKTLMRMIAVGYPEGRRVRVWETSIAHPSLRGLVGQPAYEAIECAITPKEGDSGGGLYTSDGYVAGVCNFADSGGGRGLYAAPGSIQSLLNKNHVTECSAWDSSVSSGAARRARPPCPDANAAFSFSWSDSGMRRDRIVEGLFQAQSVLAARVDRLELLTGQLLFDSQSRAAGQGVYASPQSMMPQRVPQKSQPWSAPPQASPQGLSQDQVPPPPRKPEPNPDPNPNP